MGMSVRTWEWGGCHGSREVSGVFGTLVTEKGEGGDQGLLSSLIG